ncbi:hypothetical protein ACQZV8_11560 [Magnetococcales bacterium HHB-1]
MHKYSVEIVSQGNPQSFSVDLTDEELDMLQMKAREINQMAGSNVSIRRESAE